MRQIPLFILYWLVLQTTTWAETFDCTQPIGKMKKFVSCGKAIIQADIPSEARTILAKDYPNSKILSGDLDKDGINDYAVYVTENIGNEESDRVVVLKGKLDGNYESLATSPVLPYGKGNIEIKNNSLYLQVDSTSINESYSETYQFKYRGGGIFLIGKEEVSYVPVDENHGSGSRTSTNYLTGEEIETKETDGKKVATIKKKIKRNLLRLEDFSR